MSQCNSKKCSGCCDIRYDQREEVKVFADITNTWWNEERYNFDIWASEETLYEVDSSDYPHKDQAIAFASKLQLLPLDNQIIEIAQTYLDHYLMPHFTKWISC